eukprot:TRINITY_DN4295_c0_g1_i1.p1 TRINITY_DN4295_c0_g1~~TRINITY_DN4295_c0_g1_i1.p1  ORF type:complete len:343 (-),score=59.74 TRINITY_DN4295_c0_g1_i1:8-1036(-)
MEVPEYPWLSNQFQRRVKNKFKMFHFVLANHQLYIYESSSHLLPAKIFSLDDLVETQILRGSIFDISFTNGRLELRSQSEEVANRWVQGILESQRVKQLDSDKRNIRVWFPDNNYLNVAILEGVTTAEELWWLVCEATCLNHASRPAFSIYAEGKSLSLLLRSSQKVSEVFDHWDFLEKKFAKNISGPLKFVFKPTPTLSSTMERNIKDEKATHIFYAHAVSLVENNFYILDIEEAISLAGLKAYLTLGEYNPETHTPGYLESRISVFIPKYLRDERQPQEWENLIGDEHESHVGKTPYIAKLLYLQLLRQRPYYGSVFFRVKNKSIRNNNGILFVPKTLTH